jgi:hypothetical protein
MTHRIHGAGIYANIGGILLVNVTIYIPYMDPMGKGFSQAKLGYDGNVVGNVFGWNNMENRAKIFGATSIR